MAKTSSKKPSSNHKQVKTAAKSAKVSTASVKPEPVKVGSKKPLSKLDAKLEKLTIKSMKKSKSSGKFDKEKSVGIIPVAAVPTDGKPRKNQAGLLSRDLEHFRDLLLEKRRELLGDVRSNESEALRSSGGTNLSNLPIHMADMGTDNYEQEFTLGLVEKERTLIREINAALGKIMNGTYGLCEGSGKPISKVRLEAQPWARYSIEYARRVEKGIR